MVQWRSGWPLYYPVHCYGNRAPAEIKAVAAGQTDKLKAILQTAIPYLDRKIKEDYDDLIKYKVSLKTYTPGYTTIQYLYMRSFFPEYSIATASKTAYDYFRGRTQQTWVGQGKYMQGMISLALHRTGDASKHQLPF